MRTKLFHILVAILISLSTNLNAIQIINNSEWIGCGEVFGIKEGLNGFMWFLTNDGVKKYDGKQLINYNIRYRDKNLTLFPIYNYLYNDSKENLWQVGKNGLAYKYSDNTDQFELEFDLSLIDKKNNINLSYIFFDKNDIIWMCKKNEQFLYNTKTKKTILLYNIIKNNISSIEQIDLNKYVVTTPGIIYLFNLNGDKISNLKRTHINKKTSILYTYFHKPSNNVIFCSKYKGVFLYNIKTKEISNIKKAFENVGVNSIQQYKNDSNSLLIATNGSGMYKFEVDKQKIYPIYNEFILDNLQLNNNVIKDFLIEKNEVIWISVYPHGVLKYSSHNNIINTFEHSLSNTNSLICDQVNDIIEDSDGDYCFATNNGISIYDIKHHKWYNNLYSNKAYYNYAFKSICEIKKNIFLVSGYMYGAFLVSKKDLLNKNFNTKDISKHIISCDNQINAIYKDGNNIWMGDNENLIKYNIINSSLTRYKSNAPILNITTKDDNTLWLGTMKGLNLFNKNKNIFYSKDLSTKHMAISSIYQSPEKITYIGTFNNGFFSYNNVNNNIKHYTAENSSLNSNNICKILPGSNGTIIISTDVGISNFNKRNKIFVNRYRDVDRNIINTKAAVKAKNNHFLFGSNKGVIEVDDDIFKEQKVMSKLFFHDLSINYKPIYPNTKGSPLKCNIDNCKSLKLNYNQNMFSLRVSSINFVNQANILYSWKLDGFINQWSKPSKDDVVRFLNVPPGKYHLKVRSILLDNFHILQEKDMNITIAPPIWRTFGAYCFYCLIILFIGYIVFRYLWIRKQRNDYNDKINFFINTSHDIKTPLSLIKSPIEEIIKKENLSKDGMSDAKIILKNASLLNDLVNNLIDFEKEKYLSIINVSRYRLNDFITSYINEFKQYYKDDDIDIFIHDYTDNIEVYIDKNKIASILRNILSNSMKYCKRNGRIDITLNNTAKRWQIKIRDNGIGISDDDQKKLFKYMFRGENATNLKITGSGIGLLYTFKLVKNHLGTVTFSSKLNVGTSFVLSFPLKDKRYTIVDNYEEINNGFNERIPIEKTKTLQSKDNDKFNLNQMLKLKYSVIIAEDNVDMCNFLMHNLSDNYDLRIAYNGKEALDMVDHKMPDLIVTDLMMPIIDGKTLCNIIKGKLETCHIPVILLTALNGKEDIINGLKIKADLFMSKPFDIDILKANISNLIENRQLINTAFSKNNLKFAGDNIFVGPEMTLDQEFIFKVVNVVRSNIKKDLNVEILCGLLNMSRTSLYNKIRAITGLSPSDFIRNIKMDESCKLLKSKRYTIAEVAEMVGFNDPKYFTDIFKKYYKMTPSNYMKQN